MLNGFDDEAPMMCIKGHVTTKNMHGSTQVLDLLIYKFVIEYFNFGVADILGKVFASCCGIAV